MSWRRFLVLLRGLSPNAATTQKLLARTEFGRKDRVTTVEGPKAAQSAFDAILKPPAGKKPQ